MLIINTFWPHLELFLQPVVKKEMKKDKKEFPLKIKIGFKKVFDIYKERIGDNEAQSGLREEILEIEKQYPILSEGVTDFAKLTNYQEQIDTILEQLFPSALSTNEIKFATVPFHDVAFKSTQRYKKIMEAAGKDFFLDIINFDNDNFYIMGCSIILSHYYGHKADFRRTFYYNIPEANGMIKHYRVLYNADFIEIEKTAKAIDITEADINELLESFDDVSVWKKKFPPESWIFRGFVIATLFDVTTDVSLSDFKTNLLRLEKNGGFRNTEFSKIFRAIFDLRDLKIGFTDYNEESESFERTLFKEIPSFILNHKRSQLSKDALCNASYYKLFKQKEFYCVTDAPRYQQIVPRKSAVQKNVGSGHEERHFGFHRFRRKSFGGTGIGVAQCE